MRLQRLQLEHLRSYDALDLALPDPHLQIFVGENGAGKSNLIEAISLLSMGRSCLHALPEDMLRWGGDFLRVRGSVCADDGTESSMEYVWQRSPRRSSAMFVRDVKVPLVQFIGTVPTVTFLPQDLDLFTASPSARRSFIDVLLSQLRPGFAASRIECERILKQRNALLSQIADGEASEESLELWDARFATAASLLTQHRDEVISLFNRTLQKTIASLGEGEWSDALLIHQRKTKATDATAIEAELRLLLSESRRKDLAMRTTSVGPHRDDWHLDALGHSIATFASRGQQRSALLALLLTSAALLREVRRETPIILLDDVLSELDDHHQHSLLGSLEGHQVFVTTTHPVTIDQPFARWSVGSGSVVSES
jgi:DNA replication and repair protein RecF